MKLIKQLQEKLNTKNRTYAPNGMSVAKVFHEALNNTNLIYKDVLEKSHCETHLFSNLIHINIDQEKDLYPIASPSINSIPTRTVQLETVAIKTDKRMLLILEKYKEQTESLDESQKENEELLFYYFLDSLFIAEAHEQDQEYLHHLASCGFDIDVFYKNFNSFKTIESPLESLCTNLNKKAEKGLIDPVIGRSEEILKVIEILSKRKKSNPILVGPAGCGKTSIPEGIALLINEGKVPHTMKNAVIYNLQTANMIAGTSFRGQFEEKLMALIKELQEIKNKGEIFPILFIDEIHSIVGSGDSGGLDFGNIIKPALADGSISCIGATTDSEYQRYILQEKALKRRFVKIQVKEPSVEESILILMGLKNKYEEKHKVSYKKEDIEKIVELSGKYLRNSARPDNCIDLMDYVGAVANVHNQKVSMDLIESATSKYTNVHINVIKKSNKTEETQKNKNLSSLIKKEIFGQDSAIDEVVDVLELNMAGFKEENKTLGNFLMLGPSGVGKTELAVQISKNLELPLERIDMSEFMEAHSVSKFIGAPPGFVGFEQGGKLSKIIEKNPSCILLLDEIEKAHPKVLEVLLQVMDNAKITDSQGEELSFKDVLILMTSNAGARELQTKSIGFSSGEKSSSESKSKKIVENFFTPEFRGRLDGIISFNQLKKEQVFSILDKFVTEFLNTKGSLDNNLKMTLSKKAKEYLVNLGFSESYGARPLKGVIKREIIKRIAKESLYGEIKKGKSNISVDEKNGELIFKFKK